MQIVSNALYPIDRSQTPIGSHYWAYNFLLMIDDKLYEEYL